MYKNHLKTKMSKTGLGVFTNTYIPADVPILEFTGKLFREADLPVDQNMVVQIGPDLFMGPSGDLDDIINHSCSPNCYLHILGKRAILYSLYVITPGTELTYDYSVSSTDTQDTWNMNCQCNSFKCRKVISGFQTLAPEIQELYLKRGIVPLYISDQRFSRK